MIDNPPQENLKGFFGGANIVSLYCGKAIPKFRIA
jgi:hypothetical protein